MLTGQVQQRVDRRNVDVRADHQAAAHAIAEHRERRTRHGHGSLAGGNHPHVVRERQRRQTRTNEIGRIDCADPGLQDRQEVLSERVRVRIQ
jgi:hypothetical protein